MTPERLLDAILGCLWGTALGDALGLPMEGMKAGTIRRRFADLSRFHLLGKTGRVSDDTEQTALVGQSLALARAQVGNADSETLMATCARHFRWAMRGWFLRLPFGIGLGTLRSCLKLLLGFSRGIKSAGNGAAMRAAPVGVFFHDDDGVRDALTRRLAETTHTDERAVDGARFVAEVAARCATASPTADRLMLLEHGLSLIASRDVKSAVAHGIRLAEAEMPFEDAARELGNSGYVVHSMGLIAYAFRLRGDDPMACIRLAIQMGGDTDTHAAMVGAWVGTLHGAKALDKDLLENLQGGPFGLKHLEALAVALAENKKPPSFFWPWALLRNLLLYPVVLAHGFSRIFWIGRS
jgi:ADP-ribosylglycohydrolase